MTEKLLTPSAAKSVFSEKNPEAYGFMKGGVPKYISNAELLEARAQSSYLANVIEANGGKLNSGDLFYVPAEKGQKIVNAADKEMRSSPAISGGEIVEIDAEKAYKYIQSLETHHPVRATSRNY